MFVVNPPPESIPGHAAEECPAISRNSVLENVIEQDGPASRPPPDCPTTQRYIGGEGPVQGLADSGEPGAELAAGGGKHADLSGLGSKAGPVVNRTPGFGLPLMHHFVQECVFYLGPGVPEDVPAADAYLVCSAVFGSDGQFPEAGLHPTG